MSGRAGQQQPKDDIDDPFVEAFRQDAMRECYEQTLWRDYCEARRFAEASEELSDGRYAGKAYACYMRFYLTDVEREFIEAQDEIRLLRAENALLRKVQKPSLPVPKWRDPPEEETT